MTTEEALEQMEEWHTMMTCDPENQNPLHLRYVETVEIAIKALKIIQGIEDAYMSELLKTPQERGVPISDECDGCRYKLNSTNGNPCYSCGKYKEGE